MKRKYIIVILLLIIFVFVFSCSLSSRNNDIASIKSEDQLLHFSKTSDYYREDFNMFEKILMLPFSVFYNDYYVYDVQPQWGDTWDDIQTVEEDASGVVYSNDSISSKDYSKTNIQVQGVDEADIVKTDGDYIYSISENNVIITNVKDPANIKVESKINEKIPVDLILYKDKLVIISTNTGDYYGERNTVVNIYDINDKASPKKLKSFELYEPYFTTRCIDNKLYVFSSGYLRVDNDKVVRDYKEDNKVKELSLDKIKYLKDSSSNIQTIIAEVDLNDLDKNINLDSYLIDIFNSYISENNIYLIDEEYNYNGDRIRPLDIFGPKGIFVIFDDFDYSYDEITTIYKFNINKNKGVSYSAKTDVEGSTINQYSMDEKDGNLRIALESDDGSRIAIFDDKLHLLGETESVAKNEEMRATRFVGDKAYLVTYETTDPLFVVDLSNVKDPKILGELKIPGYSTYLHPYDDTHLIGIGIETEEKISRDEFGEVISSWSVITGMKMSLFDVSDVNNPKQLAQTTIGDRRTVSAVLTNPKALLFSKEKELIAIPVNNYQEDFSIEDYEDGDDITEAFVDYDKPYISEGYFVYNINLENGFNLKGVINHEKSESTRYNRNSKLLRGLYIEDDLFTISEEAIKVNKLDNLDEISKLSLKGDK
ncbi:MAG: beta-propeller domain-containing protein [Bacilli bacterium]|nr:beta-propeller domain-containing protein [Bacilli bacterium]